MRTLALGLLGATLAGCRPAAAPRLLGESCSLAEAGKEQPEALFCATTGHARAIGLAVGEDGTVAVVGTHAGELDSGASRITSNPDGRFLLTLDKTLRPQGLVAVEAPGWLRSVFVASDGVTVVTDQAQPPEGPFLTAYDRYGRVRSRRDLAFGGIATSAAQASGSLVIRHKAQGIRLVRIAKDGTLPRGSGPLTPPYVHEFPLTIASNGMVSQLARLADDSFITVTAAAATGTPGEPTEMLHRVAPSGVPLWSRRLSLGQGVQLSAAGDGAVVLTSELGPLCPQLRPHRGFAVTRVDGSGTKVWQQCFGAVSTDLRLATRGDETVITGLCEGQLALDGKTATASPAYPRSFVLWLRGSRAERIAHFGSMEDLVAIQSVALPATGSTLVAGALAWVTKQRSHFETQQKQLFVAALP